MLFSFCKCFPGLSCFFISGIDNCVAHRNSTGKAFPDIKEVMGNGLFAPAEFLYDMFPDYEPACSLSSAFQALLLDVIFKAEVGNWDLGTLQ